jgi:crossover junction endodeoxyribonuclease RusA
MICAELPWPPSANNLFRNARGKGRVPTERYKNWIQAAGWALKLGAPQPMTGRVAVHIALVAPDERKRDADNLIKGPLDLLVRHGLIPDDSSATVRELRVMWLDRGPPCVVRVYQA